MARAEGKTKPMENGKLLGHGLWSGPIFLPKFLYSLAAAAAAAALANIFAISG